MPSSIQSLLFLNNENKCSTAKVRIKIHALSLCFIVSVLFIAVPTNNENFKFFPKFVCVLFLSRYVIV